MSKTEFKIKGLEYREKDVYKHKKAGGRVIVPVSWNRVAIVRLE